MRNKHYTPHIDELTTNIDIEIYDNSKKEWVLSTNNLPLILDSGFEIRTKYLDVEDIIGIGFKLVSEEHNAAVHNFKKAINSFSHLRIFEVKLFYIADEPMIDIICDNQILVSKMNIKNKSELEWILNRLIV